jgi:NTE family protein
VPGIAHVGVLEWLEEHQISVDFIGGTFATGMSGTEVRTFLREVDWDLVFLGEAPYNLKAFRRKEDRREFPAKLEIGLRGGVKFPSGLDPAHQIGLLLSHIALPYSEVAHFDELPTPFRCVATDMESAEVVVLEDGSLSQALLATMAIPGVFPPVRRRGQVLADGGLLDNVPADVIPRERVDFIIASMWARSKKPGISIPH